MPLDTPARTSPWTPERDERLRTLWLDGKSATEIAWTFGEGISRNAVIGRVHRLKLNELRPRPVAKPKPVGRGNPGLPKVNGIMARAEKRHRSAALAIRQHARETPFRERALPPEDGAGVDVTHLVGLLDLTADTCRWPCGDPLDHGFGFCGKQPLEGKPYCAEHDRRAHVRI